MKTRAQTSATESSNHFWACLVLGSQSDTTESFASIDRYRRLLKLNAVPTASVQNQSRTHSRLMGSLRSTMVPTASTQIGAVLVKDLVRSINGPTDVYCEADFKRWAEESPERLLEIVRRDILRPSDLTFAAEALGDIRESADALNALGVLLGHGSPLVREGAIYGLAKQDWSKFRHRLERMAKDDPSPGVREAAHEALED